MITATDVELRAGSRLLCPRRRSGWRPATGSAWSAATVPGKTTLTRVLAGESLPATGSVTRSGSVGCLPQDPRSGDPEQMASDRILSARGLDEVVEGLREEAEGQMASADPDTAERAMRRYAALQERLAAAGGYAAESQAAQICASLGLPERCSRSAWPRCPAVSAGGSSWPASCSATRTLLLDSDEPSDADSIVWLREFLRTHKGGLVVISHDVGLLQACVNRVFHLDANRAELDLYNVGWSAYLEQRETDERRRRRERSNAEKQAAALRAQADRMRTRRPRRAPPRTWTGEPSGCWPGSRASAGRAGRPAAVP